MKKTKIKFNSRISSILMVILGLLVLSNSGNAQVPNCGKFSVGIKANGYSSIVVGELVKNKPELPIFISIRSENFNLVYEGEIMDLNDTIDLELCDYINNYLVYEIKNKLGICSDTLRVSLPPVPVMTGRKVRVLCSDPLIESGELIGDTFPVIHFACGKIPQLKVNEDFLEVTSCNNFDESIMQTIYREIEGYDDWGQRFSTIDTLEVYKYPEITSYHIKMDTLYQLYCGENAWFGPQIIFNNPVNGKMDTFPLLKVTPAGGRTINFEASSFADLCNLDLKVSNSIINNTKCEKRYQVNLEIKQDCFFADGNQPLENTPVKGLTRLDRGLYRMTMSVLDVDTLAPEISIEELITTTYTSSQNCEAPLIFPDIDVTEKCSGVRRVQASSPGFFTVNLKQNYNGEWKPDDNILLPKDGMDYMEQDTIITNAFKVYIEASDSCDLVSIDSFYIQVEDNTDPTVTLLKNIRVGLTGQLTWIDVSIMNENSYDNCGVAMVLGRRVDWATAGSVNLCDGLEMDKRINPVESYYASFIGEMQGDTLGCGSWLYDEWKKDSIKYCSGQLPSGLISEIGGGWTTQIPFTCEDACRDIEVELLVIDNWCNWNTTRTTVKVKDKQPISVVQDLQSSISMNCSSFAKYYDAAVNKAVLLNDSPENDSSRMAAFASLDSLMGGYVSVWQNLDGQLIGNDGQKIIPSEHKVIVRKDKCENYTERKFMQVFDESTGELVDGYETVPAIRVVPANDIIENGIVAINCSSSTYEKILVDMDACGSGMIKRTFYVAGGCGDTGEGDWLTRNKDRIEYTREQIIYIEPDCELSEGMVDMPSSVSAVDVCKIEKIPNGNYVGELHPDFTGWPEYTWSQECRELTVGYQDKLFRLVGNNPIGQWKLVRNWYISDKCDDSDDGSVLHFEQVIIINELNECDTSSGHYLISGNIVDPEGGPIKNVTLKLQTDLEEYNAAMSSIQGTYSLSAAKNSGYKVIPWKNDEMLKGISTFDLVMIQKDVLNIKKLDNDYRRIAADVNNNGLVEATDIIELRKAILRPDFKFSNNTSYQFRLAGSKSNFFNIENLDNNKTADFIGIKTGDVNFSASNAVPTSRNRGMKIVLQDQWLQGDRTYRIPVRNEEDMDVLGFQFEWDFKSDDIKSLSLESGTLQITDEEYAILDNGKLTMSWFDINERHLDQEQILFYINIQTNRRTTLQDVISNSAEILRTESYVEPGVVQGLSLYFREMEPTVSFTQNNPNPFRDRTLIHFDQEHEGPVDVNIYDMTGKLILHDRINGQRGNNKIVISGSQLPSPGMYYYRISSQDQLWTNKMIYIQ